VLARPLADVVPFGFSLAALLYPRVRWRGRGAAAGRIPGRL